jgi:ATP-binding cassette, subfamily B, bacterial MsbA
MAAYENVDFNSRVVYGRLLAYVRPYWFAFVISLVCMGLSSALEPAFPALMKFLLDDGFSKAHGSLDWLKYPAAIFGIFIGRAIVGFAADYAMNWVSQNVIAELRYAMFDRLLRLPVSYYADNSSGRLMSRISNDVTGVAFSATSAISVVIKDSFSIIGLLAWLLYLNWKLTLVTLTMVPFIAYTVRAFSNRIRNTVGTGQTLQGDLLQVLQEAVEGFKVVRIFGGQKYETRRFKDVVRGIRSNYMRYLVAGSAQGPIVQFFAAMALSVIIGVALFQASLGTASVGDFVSFITAMLMLLAPTKRLTDVNSSIQRGLVAAESVFHLIDEPSEADTGSLELKRARGEIEFINVNFMYPGSERPALDSLSFAIRPGECVALVGPSGSGKTTVANLLPRFHEIGSGAIHVDGVSLSDIRLASLRDNIAMVSQDVVLFNDTVAANIAYGGKQDASQEEIVAAARAANALEFIEAMPQGFDTMIGEKGVKLSGGQRQRLAIARALLKNAPILILDEATSALDTESERVVQAALDQLMQGRSTLVIAHRLSTVENADRIIVLTQGVKSEEGSHAELLALDGVYARLYRRQETEKTSED